MKPAIQSENIIKMEAITPTHETTSLNEAIKKSWQRIAPFWPLKNLIAVNPLQGLEDLSIEQALIEGAAYFQQPELPKPMESVNRETIKWLQAFFDDGQATIAMPLRKAGLYHAWLKLAQFDGNLHGHDKQKSSWLASLPESSEQAIAECLLRLSIAKEDRGQFLTLLLTTLPGWAAHVKYRTEWSAGETAHQHPVSQADYLAMRLAITCLLWPEAKSLLDWHAQARTKAAQQTSPVEDFIKNETNYRLPLLDTIAKQHLNEPHTPAAQLVFCIDVRSEPFRRALEATGDYQTFGFAGFFGVPVRIKDEVTGESHASCPVLLTPKHTVHEAPHCSDNACQKDHAGYATLTSFKRFYQSLKYTFTTPFALVETLGLASGAWMGLRSFTPALAYRLKDGLASAIRPPLPIASSLEDILFADQCAYGEGALRMMGLTSHFAPLVILCGHGSTTQNNAYATALDCGACGGRHGASNARILANILNDSEVRKQLYSKGIKIPEAPRFLAAEHNTTTDDVALYNAEELEGITQLKEHLKTARETNSQWRCQTMGVIDSLKAHEHTALRSHDWAQVRPEWGLAKNAAFIVAPRDMTKQMNLEGRCFLHSYDYTQDPEGSSLTVILTAPMVVAQWINTQYLFSTLDNVAYGGGSKITKNITGKLGIMQGNASDLMTGLPVQSLCLSDTEAYHELQRLMTVVAAPRSMIDNIIAKQAVLQKLFGNGWVQLACIEPDNHQTYYLQRDLTWQKTH
jgi:uncharacterized protein YbcC (UPF0753/DUF2309 family)